MPPFTSSVVDVGVTVVRQITYLIIIIVISIYMLLDSKRLGRFVAGHFPTHSVSDGEEYVRRAKTAVVDYVKAQVLLSAVLGRQRRPRDVAAQHRSAPSRRAPATPSSSASGRPSWRPSPTSAPCWPPCRPTVVAVFDSPLSALWVIITFVLIQEIEGHILVPVIMGSRFRVHPLVVIFAILAGGEIHGITGMLIAIPLIPLVKETFVFLRPRVQLRGLVRRSRRRHRLADARRTADGHAARRAGRDRLSLRRRGRPERASPLPRPTTCRAPRSRFRGIAVSRARESARDGTTEGRCATPATCVDTFLYDC